MTPNVGAFLATVRHSEGTDKYPDPYRVCFGGYLLKDLSDHPLLTGEWTGQHWAGGFSTAAGAYQIIKPTWLALKGLLRLPDFTALSQDDAAIQLVKERGALDLLMGGRVADAIEKCSSVWASLPGSTSGQPQSKMATLINLYMNEGGSLA